MTEQYLNIAITGLSIHHSEELKTQLRNLIPQEYKIKWSTAADPTIDCLFIHENFYETDGIQKIIQSRNFPWLKITKNNNNENILQENTLSLPIVNPQNFSDWILQHLLNTSLENPNEHIFEVNPKKTPYKLEYFSKMLDKERNSKLHLFDNLGTIAIIDVQKNIAWLNTEREQAFTDSGFGYDIASTSNFMKVSRKQTYLLNDWLWQFFWDSPLFLKEIAPEDGHFKIHMWPKPSQNLDRKVVFQLSSCFIQGGKVSKIANQLNIPLETVQRFIAANIATNNLSRINIWDKHFNPPEAPPVSEDTGFIKGFFGKLRKKLGI